MKTLFNCIFFLILVISSNVSANNIMTAGKHMIDIHTVIPCPENEELESPMRNVKFVHINRTHKSLSFDVTYKRPLDENVGASANIETWGNAGWVSHPFLPFQPDICNTMMSLFKETWIIYNNGLGVKDPDKCPVPAGNYSMKNYIVDLSHATKVPVWPGRFRFKMMLQLDQDPPKTIFCNIHELTSTEVLN